MIDKVRRLELNIYHGYVHDDPDTEEYWRNSKPVRWCEKTKQRIEAEMKSEDE